MSTVMCEMMSVMKDDMFRQFAEHFTAPGTEASHDNEEATTKQASPGVSDAIDNNPYDPDPKFDHCFLKWMSSHFF